MPILRTILKIISIVLLLIVFGPARAEQFTKLQHDDAWFYDDYVLWSCSGPVFASQVGADWDQILPVLMDAVNTNCQKYRGALTSSSFALDGCAVDETYSGSSSAKVNCTYTETTIAPDPSQFPDLVYKTYYVRHNLHISKRCQSQVAWFQSSSRRCECRWSGQVWVKDKRICASVLEVHEIPPQHCPRGEAASNQSWQIGNPIEPLTGRKRMLLETDFFLSGTRLGFHFTADWRNLNWKDQPTFYRPQRAASLGHWWQNGMIPYLLTSRNEAYVTRVGGDGTPITFKKSGDLFISPIPGLVSLEVKSDYWLFTDTAAGIIERYQRGGDYYNSFYELVDISRIDGAKWTPAFSNQFTPEDIAPIPFLPIELRDGFGRTLKFRYPQPMDGYPYRFSAIEGSEGVVQFEYDLLGNLTSMSFPDNSQVKLVYEDGAHPELPTGILDADGVRLSTYAYDALGRAISTEKGQGLEKFEISYSQPPVDGTADVYSETDNVVLRRYLYDSQNPVRVVVRSPNGSESLVEAHMTANLPMVASRTQPAGSGCGAAASRSGYDANGNVAWREDFNGHRSCFAYDLDRNLMTSRVEGLAANTSCDALSTNAAWPIGSRKVSTAWHPKWRLETKIAEPGSVTTRVYNGQPDPFAGNAIASCAPASAVLPDGKPIVVLCKEVQQASTDTTGVQGLSPSLSPGVAARVQSWTYNQYGQILTHDGPRTDVSDVTVYEYYTSTDSEWTVGDLKQVTNAAGQVTRFPKYTPSGQALQKVDANGVVTDYSYDLRQRLKSISTAGATYSLDYHKSGLLKSVTEPDESFLAFEYDTAQRLVAVKDHLGNRIDYTLDKTGNRTAERVKDPRGVLHRSVRRSFDALGRVQQLRGRE